MCPTLIFLQSRSPCTRACVQRDHITSNLSLDSPQKDEHCHTFNTSAMVRPGDRLNRLSNHLFLPSNRTGHPSNQVTSGLPTTRRNLSSIECVPFTSTAGWLLTRFSTCPRPRRSGADTLTPCPRAPITPEHNAHALGGDTARVRSSAAVVLQTRLLPRPTHVRGVVDWTELR